MCHFFAALQFICGLYSCTAQLYNSNFILQNVFGVFSEINYGNPTLRPRYDYVIVGAGPAGCVLANRLSEDLFKTVLLLEIGKGEISLFTDPPLTTPTLALTDYNFGYKTEVQKYGCQGNRDKRCAWTHGRAVGGSTVINDMIFTRGNRRDFDSWARAGNPGWSWEEVLPYFEKLEHANIRDFDHNGFHGKHGPLSVEDVPFRSKIADAVVKGAQQAGLTYLDYNAGEQIGVSYLQAQTRHGRRATGGNSFLKDIVDRPNLHIKTRSWVTKILIDPHVKEARGVQYIDLETNKTHTVRATREVIVSAGAFEGPKLLMLSGVGPAKHLEEHGISVLQDLPVGGRLLEHVGVYGPIYIVQNDPDGFVNSNVVNMAGEYLKFTNGTGLFTTSSVETLMYVKSPFAMDPDPGLPDLEIMQALVSLGFDRTSTTKLAYRFSDELFDEYFKPLGNYRAFMYLSMFMKSQVKGHLLLKSTNPFEHPVFKYQFLEDERDVDALVYGILFAINVTSQPAFKHLGAVLYANKAPGCKQFEFNTIDYWRCHVRTVTASFQHQVGTCKMGPASDPDAVVDHRLRVHGIKRLRVVDTSIIPELPSGHPSAFSYLFGEKAADMIKEENDR